MLTEKEKQEIEAIRNSKEYKAGVRAYNKSHPIDKEKKKLYQMRWIAKKGAKILAEKQED